MTRAVAKSKYRTLSFGDVQDVLAEVDRLRERHACLGNWSLAQTCWHLAESLSATMDGFGVDRHWLMRTLFGRYALRRVFATNSLDSGFTVTDALNPPATIDLNEAVESLRAAISRYRAFDDELDMHPFFGRLSRTEWDRLHCIHAAHHLRRIVPAADSSG